MMTSRTHVHEEQFATTPERLFALLHTPSDIRAWWGASRVIAIAKPGGVLAVAWGDDEDNPDYISAAAISEFVAPDTLVLSDYRYHAKGGSPPDADYRITFTVRDEAGGATLRMEQVGFPEGRAGDEFLAACDTGWRDTFAGIRAHLQKDDAAA